MNSNLDKDKALTYSILAHIRSKSTLIKGPLDIFVPLVKRALSKMNTEGTFRGKSISEIKYKTDHLYSIDIPIPTLDKILQQIALEINKENIVFNLYQDKSFAINGYIFTEFEEDIRKHKIEIDKLEKLFQDFCKLSEIEISDKSIFRFIEKNKISLSKYLSKIDYKNGHDYSIEAQFIEYFKRITPVYELIKEIYLGSILAGYIEYTASTAKIDVELLLDTNFILGLLDLNTPESTHTCSTLLTISQSQGYTCKVLSDTIEEIKALIKNKSEYFDQSFLQRIVYPEDIYNACERKNLSKVDLERISDNLEEKLSQLKIYIIPETTKFRNEARFSDEYKVLKKIRNSEKSALHDATALIYVKKKRGRIIYDFEKANCWFVNNAISREGNSSFDPSGKQPEIIKADDLLNILWLSNPSSKLGITDPEIIDIGLSSLISLTLNESLPKTSIIRELEDNIQKYSNDNVSDTDIIRIATRITNKQLKNIEELNELANSDKEEFVKRLQAEAKEQENIEQKRLQMLELAVEKMSKKGETYESKKKEYEEKSKTIDIERYTSKLDIESKNSEIENLKNKLLKEKNEIRKGKREKYIQNSLSNWRRKSWRELIFSILLILIFTTYICYKGNWSYEETLLIIPQFQNNIILSGIITILSFLFTAVVLKTIYDKYRNHSNIENFKKSIDIPRELQDLEYLNDEIQHSNYTLD